MQTLKTLLNRAVGGESRNAFCTAQSGGGVARGRLWLAAGGSRVCAAHHAGRAAEYPDLWEYCRRQPD